jgi:hypothetical protein
MSTRLEPEDLLGGDPIRSWNKLYRTNERPEETGDDGSPEWENSTEPEEAAKNRSVSWDSIANDAIERGYQVIEEQIRQGEQVARQMRGYKDDVQKVNNDISRLFEKSLGFYKDVGYLWFDLVESFLRNPAIKNGELYQAFNPNAQASPSTSYSANGVQNDSDNGVEIALNASRVRIDLNEPVHAGLIVQPLRAIDESIPAIKNVEFREVDGRTVLRVSIPPNQPAASYMGVILDKRSNLPKGTVTVVIDNDKD